MAKKVANEESKMEDEEELEQKMEVKEEVDDKVSSDEFDNDCAICLLENDAGA